MTVRILVGDVRERLAELPDGSVQCCVTSPPYFGLRDYGTAAWSGGDPDCDHIKRTMKPSQRSTLEDHGADGRSPQLDALPGIPYRDVCGKCGAVRQDRQIGLEATLAEYVQTLVAVFREVRRVLRDDGTLWLNLGDSYCGSWGNYGGQNRGNGSQREITNGSNAHQKSYDGLETWRPATTDQPGLKPKDLMMVPARVALALQDDGWYLRSDVIWHKPNPMPESVTDRPTSAHEHIFLLTKQARYYYDADAIRETSVSDHPSGNGYKRDARLSYGGRGDNEQWQVTAQRNCRNVWTVATAPYKEAHFATFPPELPRRCILAGTSEKGACAACGAPWVRCVERTDERIGTSRGGNYGGIAKTDGTKVMQGGYEPGMRYVTIDHGWRAGCECDAGVVPCVVLDPFAGAGTALLVADQLGRDAIGVELNPEYAALIERRLKEDAPMFVELETVALPAQVVMAL